MANNKTRRKKLSIIIICCVLLALAILVTAIIVLAQRNSPASMPPEDGANIVVEGEYVCLPKHGSGEQTLECALGLKTDGDLYYSLQFGGSAYIGYQTGKRLHVVGTFHDTDQSPYASIGKIVVSEVEQLD